mmetsp:Transcript_106554/g.296598  ORF Transcript_106554/g.296598 Transcript_106554/m.296598 type:complete len:118 (-) Transcript_106554:155-508(-)
MYIDLSFKTEEAGIPTMRVVWRHLPPEGGHHIAEEFSSILQGRHHEGEGVGNRIEDLMDSSPERGAEFSELLGAVGLRALNTFRGWDTMQSDAATHPTATWSASTSGAPWTTCALTA